MSTPENQGATLPLPRRRCSLAIIWCWNNERPGSLIPPIPEGVCAVDLPNVTADFGQLTNRQFKGLKVPGHFIAKECNNLMCIKKGAIQPPYARLL